MTIEATTDPRDLSEEPRRAYGPGALGSAGPLAHRASFPEGRPTFRQVLNRRWDRAYLRRLELWPTREPWASWEPEEWRLFLALMRINRNRTDASIALSGTLRCPTGLKVIELGYSPELFEERRPAA